MTFNYEDDVLIENLEYYIDGQMISQNDRKNVLCAFFQEHIGDGLPKKYETNETKLNSGAYAKYTNQANAYFQSYEAVKDIDIETGDKLLLILKARTYRGKANEEYITEENSWNFIWDCLAANEVLSTCIVDSTDEDEIKEYQALMKECNRDIMCAAWNILRIRYHFDHTVDAGAKEKLKEAYKWERDHAPESGVDYDMLIWAVENLNG